VHFIDDDDFVPAVDWFVLHSLPQRSHFIDPAVGSTVDLENIDGPVFVYGPALFTLVAWDGSRPLLTVEGLGQDPGSGGFSHPPHPREYIGLSDPIVLDRILEGLNHRLLADHPLERLRSVFAGID